jgi:hypothetical protein
LLQQRFTIPKGEPDSIPWAPISTPILSFFSSQLIEEWIQYIINVPVRVLEDKGGFFPCFEGVFGFVFFFSRGQTDRSKDLVRVHSGQDCKRSLDMGVNNLTVKKKSWAG